MPISSATRTPKRKPTRTPKRTPKRLGERPRPGSRKAGIAPAPAAAEPAVAPPGEFTVRPMRAPDLAAVLRIYRALVQPIAEPSPRRGTRERASDVLGPRAHARAVSLVAVDARGRVVGYLVGDVRRWEFGSAPAGWVFAIGVDRRVERQGLGRALLEEAMERFRGLGVDTVRTMVRREDVPTLRFFRSGGFTAGPYVEMERGPASG